MKKTRDWVYYIMTLAQMLFYLVCHIVLMMSGHPIIGWIAIGLCIGDILVKTAICIVGGMYSTNVDDFIDVVVDTATVTDTDEENEA